MDVVVNRGERDVNVLVMGEIPWGLSGSGITIDSAEKPSWYFVISIE